MKHTILFAPILLLAPTIAQAQYWIAPPVPASSTIAPFLTPRADTPALDAFAGVGRQLLLQTRWVQIDADVLPDALPAWNKPGASSHVVTPNELRALEILRAAGTASVVEQKINAVNNQAANLSFEPFSFTFIDQPTLTQKGSLSDMVIQRLPLAAPDPIDEMIIPRLNSAFDAYSYIPNLAKPQSKLPQMAPMPGASGKTNVPFSAPLRSSNPDVIPPVSRRIADALTYKFQLRPTFVGDKIALELRDSNSANRLPLTTMVKPGEAVVFSFPNILTATGNRRTRLTFLLVTPLIVTTTAMNSTPKAPTKPMP